MKDQVDVLIQPTNTDPGAIRPLRIPLELWAYARKESEKFGFWHGSEHGLSRVERNAFLASLRRAGDSRLTALVDFIGEHCQRGLVVSRVPKLGYEPLGAETEQPTKRDPVADVDLSMFEVQHAGPAKQEKPPVRYISRSH